MTNREEIQIPQLIALTPEEIQTQDVLDKVSAILYADAKSPDVIVGEIKKLLVNTNNKAALAVAAIYKETFSSKEGIDGFLRNAQIVGKSVKNAGILVNILA